VTWFNQTLSVNPEEAVAKPEEVFPPKGLPDIMITSLDQKLASARGLARSAYLVGATYADKRRAHLLAILDPVPGAETALARAAREALVFSGIEAGEMDVTFFRSSDAIAARLAKVGIRFDLPKADKAEGPQAPGMNPDRPPRLK
jgi:hypothetical protein